MITPCRYDVVQAAFTPRGCGGINNTSDRNADKDYHITTDGSNKFRIRVI